MPTFKKVNAGFRVSGIANFPTLFEGRTQQQDSGKTTTTWSVNVMLDKEKDKEDIEAISKFIDSCVEPVLESHFKGHKPRSFPFWYDGDTSEGTDGVLRKEKYPELAGKMVLVCRTGFKPPIFDGERNQVDEDPEYKLIYSGSDITVICNVVPYDASKFGGRKGLKCVLVSAQGYGTGERIEFASPFDPDQFEYVESKLKEASGFDAKPKDKKKKKK